VKDLDLNTLPGARAAFRWARRRGVLRRGQAETIRFLTARAVAIRHGKEPAALLIWLLRRPEAQLPLYAEDEAIALIRRRRPRTTAADSEPVHISHILASSPLLKAPM
jgi:hypothetical protein